MSIKLFQLIFYFLRLSHSKVKVTARIPLSQALLESATWSSPLYRTSNNMFGMMFPVSRVTTATGKTANGYAAYRSPFDCIRDYFNWLEAFNIYDDNALDAFLTGGHYATDPKYYVKVTKLANEIDAQLISPTAFGAATLGTMVATLGVGIAMKKS